MSYNQDKLRQVSQVNEIIPNLYLTSVYGATKANIIARNISLIINSAVELPKQDIPGVQSVKISLKDKQDEQISFYFDWAADLINTHLANKTGGVMVHCVMGISRSTTLVVAYLMKHRKMSLKSALSLCSSRRPIIRPNSGFYRQLLEYEQTLNPSIVYNQNYGDFKPSYQTSSSSYSSFSSSTPSISPISHSSSYSSLLNTLPYSSASSSPSYLSSYVSSPPKYSSSLNLQSFNSSVPDWYYNKQYSI